jgi:FMN phosphatase YigB (HAD superfamily)
MENKPKIDTILFDLDGTLLNFSQKEFIETYFSKLGKVFARLSMNPEQSIKAVWAGTKAMFMNDGSMTNHERFWTTFAESTGLTDDEDRLKEIENACDNFYSNEFDEISSIVTPSNIPKRLVQVLKEKGYSLILATNPLFPACAVATRLSWVGLELRDFDYFTHYSNCTYCKPNPEFYREILTKTGKKEEHCLMAGNSPVEDMSAAAVGMEIFLVTDCLENETNTDISAFRQGTLEELEEYLISL